VPVTVAFFCFRELHRQLPDAGAGAGAVDQSTVSRLKPSLPNVVQGDEQVNCWRG
jgi:hypothetical protein